MNAVRPVQIREIPLYLRHAVSHGERLVVHGVTGCEVLTVPVKAEFKPENEDGKTRSVRGVSRYR